MMKKCLIILTILLPVTVFSQVIIKPRGCFAGTNGTNPEVLSHPQARGVLLMEKWSEIEPKPGIYDFSVLDNKINAVKTNHLKYALAIAGGAFGSPAWLIDSLNTSYFNFQYRNDNWKLPLWWDTVCTRELNKLIIKLGDRYANDSMLSHVYVTQMTVNGVEGHLNGLNMTDFTSSGFTKEKWISAAISTSNSFAQAFRNKPIVFEVHEIDHDSLIPASIINNLTNNPDYCNRIGLGMWWLSGKTSYQPKLLEYIFNFQGDKYAQVIGRSDQPERFNDGLYSSVFTQAKYLGIRYIEPWPYEFQYHTKDSLIQDFNNWADKNFPPTDACLLSNVFSKLTPPKKDINIYPNPAHDELNFNIDFQHHSIRVEIFNINGKQLLTATNQNKFDIRSFQNGIYFIRFKTNKQTIVKKFVKTE